MKFAGKILLALISVTTVWMIGVAISQEPAPGDSEFSSPKDLMGNPDSLISEGIIITEFKMEKGRVDITTQNGFHFKFDLGSGEIPVPEVPELKGVIDIPKIPPLPGKKGIIINRKGTSLNGEIVKVGKDVVVGEGERVSGSITVIDADVTVKGEVEGDVVAIGGNILVTSTGKIYGSATSLGGKVEKEQGAIISGEQVGTSITKLKPPSFSRFPVPELVLFVISLSLALVVITLAPKNVGKVGTFVRSGVLKSLLFGYLYTILIPLAFIILLVTVVGIPVAILGMPLLILVAVALGFTAVSNLVGNKFLNMINSPERSSMVSVMVGATLLQGAFLIGSLFDILKGLFGGMGTVFKVIGVILMLFVVTPIAFGSAITTVLGTRPREVAPSNPAPAQQEK